MSLDDWTDDPPQGPFPKWFWGCVVPLAVAAYAIWVITSGEGTLPGRYHRRLVLHGTDATLYGIAWLAGALFTHAHYFWGNTDKLAPFSPVGKVAGLLVFVGSAAALLFRGFILN